MNNYSKVILVIFIAVVTGIVCFFYGRKVERDNYYDNKATVVQNDKDTINSNYEDLDTTTYVPNNEYNDVTTNLNTNENN